MASLRFPAISTGRRCCITHTVLPQAPMRCINYLWGGARRLPLLFLAAPEPSHAEEVRLRPRPANARVEPLRPEGRSAPQAQTLQLTPYVRLERVVRPQSAGPLDSIRARRLCVP